MKAKGFILLLAALVFVSGCVSNTKVDPNNGLSVNEFSADPGTVEGGEAARFFVDVENVGGTTASCVTTELFGVDSWYDEMGQPLSLLRPFIPTKGLSFSWANGILNLCYTNLNYGQICAGGNTRTGENYYLSSYVGNTFLDFSNQFCSVLDTIDQRLSLVKSRPELLPPVPSTNRPGQSYTAEWVLRPPILPEGVQVTYPITARTSYFYSTNAVMNVQAFSKAEYKRKTDLGQQTQYPLVVENSFGAPIKIMATRGSSPIVVNPDSLSGIVQYESYIFEFANLGEGFPLPMNVNNLESTVYTSPQTQSGFVFATMRVDGPGVIFSDCLGQGGQEVFITGDALQNIVKIRGDQRVPVGCTIAIDRTRWQDTPMATVSFTFNLWYRYYIDRTVNVVVKGVEGLPGQAIVRGIV
ncbi:MAG: hypothetical protein NT120_01810 [Candidatus Aenigmarchaeota archaeon]|nr:hypothetical protein [Candidatus Aenigmarchaeota archaeon]